MLRGLFLAIDWWREKGCQVRADRGRKSLLSSCEGINCSSSWLSGHVYSGEKKLINSQWVTQLTGNGANYNRTAPSATCSRKVRELKEGSAARHFKGRNNTIYWSINQSISQLAFIRKVLNHSQRCRKALCTMEQSITPGATLTERESNSHVCWSEPQVAARCTMSTIAVWDCTLFDLIHFTEPYTLTLLIRSCSLYGRVPSVFIIFFLYHAIYIYTSINTICMMCDRAIVSVWLFAVLICDPVCPFGHGINWTENWSDPSSKTVGRLPKSQGGLTYIYRVRSPSCRVLDTWCICDVHSVPQGLHIIVATFRSTWMKVNVHPALWLFLIFGDTKPTPEEHLSALELTAQGHNWRVKLRAAQETMAPRS